MQLGWCKTEVVANVFDVFFFWHTLKYDCVVYAKNNCKNKIAWSKCQNFLENRINNVKVKTLKRQHLGT